MCYEYDKVQNYIPIKDHLGVEYTTKSEMCRAYGITLNVFNYRLSKGYTLENALIFKLRPDVVIDHLGNTYKTIAEMIDYYGISYGTYKARIRAGLSIEDALTKPIIHNNLNVAVQDHLGFWYDSVELMCEDYDISYHTYKKRRNNGMSLKDSLEKSVHKNCKRSNGINIKCADHEGRTFDSVTDMCKYHNINRSTYELRTARGLSIKEALEPVTYKIVKDHLGNTYSTVKAMCAEYNIAIETFRGRLHYGWSLEDSLLKPNTKRSVEDHTGVIFTTQKAMLDYWGISVQTYQLRKSKGWSLEKILTTPCIVGAIGKVSVSHDGCTYSSVADMCRAYNVDVAIYRCRKSKGWSTEKALTTPIRPKAKVSIPKDHLGNIYKNLDEMCNHYGISKSSYRRRLNLGYTLEEILTTPVRLYNTKENGSEECVI